MKGEWCEPFVHRFHGSTSRGSRRAHTGQQMDQEKRKHETASSPDAHKPK